METYRIVIAFLMFLLFACGIISIICGVCCGIINHAWRVVADLNHNGPAVYTRDFDGDKYVVMEERAFNRLYRRKSPNE